MSQPDIIGKARKIQKIKNTKGSQRKQENERRYKHISAPQISLENIPRVGITSKSPNMVTSDVCRTFPKMAFNTEVPGNMASAQKSKAMDTTASGVD